MFGFHKRSRSLIPVSDLEKTEKQEHSQLKVSVEEHIEDDEADSLLESTSPQHVRNRTMIYLLFLAEAIMAASLSSQVAILAPSRESSCFTPDSSFLSSILQSAYMFGSTAGVVWGWTVDRFGRRNTALLGLVAMSLSCLSTGFARSFIALVILRFIAGVTGSAMTVAGLTMLADTTHGSSKNRVALVVRLPFVAVAGSLGPLAASSIRNALEGLELWVSEDYPGLASQIVCGSLVLSITVVEILLLKETLPEMATFGDSFGDDLDNEKLAFMNARANESSETLETTSLTSTSPVLSTSHMISAPAITILLASFSLLLLHSSTFSILITQSTQLSSHESSAAIPCEWGSIIALVINASAALFIMQQVPKLVVRTGVLSSYRSLSLGFPAVYTIVPVVGILTAANNAPPIFFWLSSLIAMLIKAALTNAAYVLIIMLILSAAPDASSTGKMIGVMYIGYFFSALAVGVSGLCYYASDEYPLMALTGSLWGGLVAISAIGVGITWKLREKPRVGTDIPEECLVWEDMFDSESDHEMA